MSARLDVKMQFVRALTKYYIFSVLVIITVAFPDQGKRDFILSRVFNVPHLVLMLEDIYLTYVVLTRKIAKNCSFICKLIYKLMSAINSIADNVIHFQTYFDCVHDLNWNLHQVPYLKTTPSLL
jgi:hypothetical protein